MLTIITNLNDKLQDFKIYDKNVKPWCSGCTEQSRHKHNPCVNMIKKSVSSLPYFLASTSVKPLVTEPLKFHSKS